MKSAVLFLFLFFLAVTARAGVYEDLLAAVSQHQTDTVSQLLQRGMDPNTSDSQGNSLLMLAASDGDLPTVELLLRNKANVLKRNAYKDTAVLLAALRGHTQCVSALIKAGADINSAGWTPLIYAAFSGQENTLRFLLMQGANINAQSDSGVSALMAATRNNQIQIVRTLIEFKVDPGLRNQQNQTALEIAVASEHSEIANMLRDYESTR